MMQNIIFSKFAKSRPFLESRNGLLSVVLTVVLCVMANLENMIFCIIPIPYFNPECLKVILVVPLREKGMHQKSL